MRQQVIPRVAVKFSLTSSCGFSREKAAGVAALVRPQALSVKESGQFERRRLGVSRIDISHMEGSNTCIPVTGSGVLLRLTLRERMPI